MQFSAQAATVLAAAVPGVAQGSNKTMSPRQAMSTITLSNPPASDDGATLAPPIITITQGMPGGGHQAAAEAPQPAAPSTVTVTETVTATQSVVQVQVVPSVTTLVAVLPIATTVRINAGGGRPAATVTVPGLTLTRTILTAGPTMTRKVAGWVDTSTIYRTVVAGITGIGESDPLSTSSSSSSVGFFVGTKTVTAASVTVTQVTTTTATTAKPTTIVGNSSGSSSSSSSKSGSYCCLEGWRPDLEWVGDRHMIANVWTNGWGDERDGCHKGMLDNLRALRGSMDMVWKCRPDEGGGGARAQFSFVTLQGSTPITDIIKVASPGGRDKGVECSLGCPPEKLWDWAKSEWL